MGKLTKNDKDVVITPRNGKNWCDVVNKNFKPPDPKYRKVIVQMDFAELEKRVEEIIKGM